MGGERGNILVTGGAGYVGSHACKALAGAGYRPVCYDNLERGHAAAVRWGPLEQGDVLDGECLDRVLDEYRPQAVMHFAAFAYVGESVNEPGMYFRNNVAGSLSLLEAMGRHGVKRFIFSSTCAVYGTPDEIPITESAPLRPISPYGSSKRMVEEMLAHFHRAHGLEYVALRYFNAAGADPDGEIGELHEPETHLIPLALHAARGMLPRLEVYGNDYDTPDGTCIRDYVHVTDIADAHVRALEFLRLGKGPATCNLGNSAGSSVREVIAMAARVTGCEIPVRDGPRRPGDPARLIADASRSRRELGWNPALSDLETIIRSAWNWEQNRD